MIKKIVSASVFGLIAPFIVLAAGTSVYEFTVLPDRFENIFEIVNLLLSLVAAAFAVKLAALSQGGSLEKTWNGLAIASVLFAFLEIFNALEGFGLVHLSGLDEMLELVMVFVLLITFYKTRKDLLQKILGK